MQESLKKLQDYKSSYQKEMSVEAFEGIRRGLIDLTLSMISAFEEEITETTNKIEEVRLERSKKDSKLSA